MTTRREKSITLPEIAFGDSIYLMNPQDARLFQSGILPGIQQGRKVNLFCSFSYFTSNYTGIFLMRELSNFVKQGCELYLVMWDINCECHPWFKRLISQGNNAEHLLESKLREILGILQSFGAPLARVHLYRASDLLKRLTRLENPNLFMKFYSVMEKLELNTLVHHHKASHLIQMPLDMFFANFLQVLYPEDIKGHVELALCYGYQRGLFNEVLRIMYSQEIIDSLKPLILTLPNHPYLVHNGAIPEWEMSRDEIVQHIVQCNPKTSDIEQMYTAILRHFLDQFEILSKDNKTAILKLEEFLRKHKTLSLLQQQVSLGYNLHKYLLTVKSNISTSQKQVVLHIDNEKDASLYAKLLSRKPIVEILKRANGTRNATQLARELKIARSNMSTYLNLLKQHELIAIDEEGKISRKVSAITTNFEVGLR